MDEYYIGIDFGGTNIRAVAYSYKQGEVLHVVQKAVKRCVDVELEMDQNVKNLIDHILSLCNPAKLRGIGLAMAALFNRKDGAITEWPNNPLWNGFPIKSYLEQLYHVPVVLEDDANAAALGEQIFGAGRGHESLMYVCVSTGIGCGIIIHNQLFLGNSGFAGELGHIKVTDEQIQCTCKSMGCLQAVASGPALLRTYNTMRKKYYADYEYRNLAEVSQLAYQKQEDAVKLFVKAGKYIGDSIANAVMLFDVPIVILGGGVMKAGDVIYKPIKSQIECSLQNKKNVSIVCSGLGDWNGILGALVIAIRKGYSNDTKKFAPITIPTEIIARKE